MAKYFRITEIDAETFERMTGDELDCLQVVAPADDGNVYAAVDEELEDFIEVYLDLFDREKLLKEAAKHELHCHWVKGHAENEYNNRCDALAVAERDKYALK